MGYQVAALWRLVEGDLTTGANTANTADRATGWAEPNWPEIKQNQTTTSSTDLAGVPARGPSSDQPGPQLLRELLALLMA